MKLNRLMVQLAVLGLGAHIGAAMAQNEGAKLERVEVTGSSIKRIKDEGALPLQVITRKDIERQGIVSAEQLIATLSVNGNGLDNLASNADVVAGQARGNNGASSANLRGQGAASTLILLNGRRVAAHGLNGGVVDLQQIPFAAVERVEILKDGASAIYGTDAIGGVINFILRKDFAGLEGAGLHRRDPSRWRRHQPRVSSPVATATWRRTSSTCWLRCRSATPRCCAATSATSSTPSSPTAACRWTRAARPTPPSSRSTASTTR